MPVPCLIDSSIRVERPAVTDLASDRCVMADSGLEAKLLDQLVKARGDGGEAAQSIVVAQWLRLHDCLCAVRCVVRCQQRGAGGRAGATVQGCLAHPRW